MSPDVVFNALHGRWGEDGCVQGLLEWLNIPYTHSGVLTSSICMNKEKTKLAYSLANLPSPKSIINSISKTLFETLPDSTYVVKPINEGSSLGIKFISRGANDVVALGDEFTGSFMIEQFIPGKDLTVTVLGSGSDSKALAVTDIITDSWYDYHSKYSPGGSTHILPANIPIEIKDLCLTFATRAHQELGCRGISRTDFRWDSTKGEDGIYLLETNNQPGMTPTSLAPEQALFCGITISELCSSLVEDASCNR